MSVRSFHSSCSWWNLMFAGDFDSCPGEILSIAFCLGSNLNFSRVNPSFEISFCIKKIIKSATPLKAPFVLGKSQLTFLFHWKWRNPLGNPVTPFQTCAPRWFRGETWRKSCVPAVWSPIPPWLWRIFCGRNSSRGNSFGIRQQKTLEETWDSTVLTSYYLLGVRENRWNKMGL